MDTFLCPKAHASTEPDYCSECGAKIQGGTAAQVGASAGPSGAGTTTGELCPDCGTPREASGSAFCEICGYNFVTGAHGEMPPAQAVSPASNHAASSLHVPSQPQQPSPVPPASWTVVVLVDPSLREAGSPEPPVGVGPFTFDLKTPVSLIGRRSEARAIFPEIPLAYDDAVSHRHALLQIDAQGGLQLRDIGAANGTRLNGRDVIAMVDTPLADGDQITLGHWSRIVVKAGA